MQQLFFGNFRSSFSGKWVEFQDFKEYSYGDDARNIDWLRSSRENSTIIRKYREEKHSDIYIICDMRESLEYQSWVKKQLLENIISLLSLASRTSNMDMKTFIFQKNHTSYIPSKKNLEMWSIISSYYHNYRGIGEKLQLDTLLHREIKKWVVFVVTDSFYYDSSSFAAASLKHDIIFIHMSSAFEVTLNKKGLSTIKSWFFRKTLNLDDTGFTKSYREKREKYIKNMKTNLKNIGIDSVFLDESSNIFQCFLELMQNRKFL